MLKEKDLSSKNSISSKTILQNEGEIKIFSDEQKLREFVTSWPSLQEILKGVCHDEMKGY